LQIYDDTQKSLIFHPLLALIASVTGNELARYVEFPKEENKILRNCVPGQIHTKPHEHDRIVKSSPRMRVNPNADWCLSFTPLSCLTQPAELQEL
jgi:hypothetical protein